MADYMAIICLNEHESIESNEWRGQESLPSARKAAIIYLKGVDASRVYICGTSNGALGGWGMVQSYPGLFAGAMLVAAVPQGSSGGVPVCVVTGQKEGNQGNAMANLEARTGAATMYLYRPQWNHGQTCQQSFREEKRLDWLMGGRSEE